MYLELVILDNIWADALVLFGTAKWLQTPYAKGRVWAGAAAGTAYAVLSLARGFVFLQHPLIKIAMSFGMVFIAFGFGGKAQYARHCAVFWLFSVLLAAGVQLYGALFGKTGLSGGFLAVSGPPLWAFLLFSWGAGALALWAQRQVRQKAVQSKTQLRATLHLADITAEAVCTLDTGHALYCPTCGLPVLFWPHEAALETACVEKLTAQPVCFATAAGQSEITAYRPCVVQFDRDGQQKTVPCAVALSKQIGRAALFPAAAAIGYFEEG